MVRIVLPKKKPQENHPKRDEGITHASELPVVYVLSGFVSNHVFLFKSISFDLHWPPCRPCHPFVYDLK